jgi:hypothetical protein
MPARAHAGAPRIDVGRRRRHLYQNTGSGAEVNPTVTFTIPAGATLDQGGCPFSSQKPRPPTSS